MQVMSERVSKQIKLTDEEHSLMQRRVGDSDSPTQKAFLDSVLDNFLQVQSGIEQVEFLMPAKSGRPRTVWLDKHVIKKMKSFACLRDVSENAVIFTAVKRCLIDTTEFNHA
jgi:hypothetical protein